MSMGQKLTPLHQPMGGSRNQWSNKRKLRLLRTFTIVLAFFWLVGRCSGGDEPQDSEPETTTTVVSSETTVAPEPATSLDASASAVALSSPRYQGGAATMAGKVLIAAGLDDLRNSTDTILEFDPNAEFAEDTAAVTTELGTLPAVLHKTMVAPIGPDVYVFGGAEGNTRFDTVTKISPDGTSTAVGTLPAPRSDGVAVSADDGSVFIVGGTDGNDASLDVLRTTDGLNFEVVATLEEAARYPAVTIAGGQIWVIGGSWEGETIASIQTIEIATGATMVLAEMPEPIAHAMAFTVQGSVFVAGGLVGDARTDAIMHLDPITGAAAPGGKLPNPLSDAGIAQLGDTVYLLGGLTPEVTDQIIELTPK